jgi:hypothetical protein
MDLLNTIIGYFDLQSARRQPDPEAFKRSHPNAHIVWQYLALVAGILIQPFLARYSAAKIWDFHGFSGWLLFALIVGLVIFPGVYKKAFDPASSPILVQLCAIFASGIGWQSLLATAGKGLNLTS